MRYLHAVGVSERFVASGVYVHHLEDRPTGTSEQWSIHELPDGAQMIRVDDDHRKRDGSSVLIEAWREPERSGGHIARVDLHGFGGKDAEISDVRASYIVNENVLEFGRSVDKGDREYDELALPETYILSPESLIFGGFEVDELATRGVETPVIGYLPAFVSEQAFSPLSYPQGATFIEERTMIVAGKPYMARMFEQINPLSGEQTTLWVDRHEVLLQYRSADGRHSAILTDYARRPD